MKLSNIENKIENKIEIELLEKADGGLSGYGSTRFSVNVIFGKFGGGYEQLWIDNDELVSFKDKLLKFEESRKGEVQLNSTSPDEFSLKISAIDNFGHLQVDISLTIWNAFPYRGPETVSLCGGFEFDPGLLAQFARSLCYEINQSS